MKKRFAIIPFLLAILITMITASCEVEFVNNGKLDGYWRLMKVDTLATKGSLDLSKRLIFWGVEAHLLEVVDRDTVYVDYLMHFDYENDKLTLGEPYHYKQQIVDSLVTDAKELNSFGINKIKESFNVEKVSGSKMVLSSETLRLWFDKY